MTVSARPARAGGLVLVNAKGLVLFGGRRFDTPPDAMTFLADANRRSHAQEWGARIRTGGLFNER